MSVKLCRCTLERFIAPLATQSANPGLLLRRGLAEYEEGANQGDSNKGGTGKSKLIKSIASCSASPLYQAAFKRWKTATDSDRERFIQFEADLLGRLYIGLSHESALETGISVQHAYGMPMIPGSAIKGLARSCALEQLKGKADAMTWLFGNEHDVDTPEQQETGGIVFHDAWWVPNGKPFVEEIVTPHHTEYYAEGKAHATDFDSPIPAPQIAAQGSFLFVLEGNPAWRSIACTLLKSGLENIGIGGKTTSGYGLFNTIP